MKWALPAEAGDCRGGCVVGRSRQGDAATSAGVPKQCGESHRCWWLDVGRWARPADAAFRVDDGQPAQRRPADADGRQITVSEDDHGDLFWGLRGAGANFGIALGFTFRLHRAGPSVVSGAAVWPARQRCGQRGGQPRWPRCFEHGRTPRATMSQPACRCSSLVTRSVRSSPATRSSRCRWLTSETTPPSPPTWTRSWRCHPRSSASRVCRTRCNRSTTSTTHGGSATTGRVCSSTLSPAMPSRSCSTVSPTSRRRSADSG